MNQITLPAADLKQALPGLSKIIGKRTKLPVLSHIRLTRNPQGDVNLEATDLDSTAIYHVPEAQEGAPVDVLVPFESLNKLVKGMGGKEIISFIPDGKKQVKIKYPLGGSMMEQKLETLPVEEFPPQPKVNQSDIKLGPEFGVALKQALACCSDDPSRTNIRGAYVDVADKKLHYIVGTNGRALYSANSFAFDLKKSVIVPDSKFLEWTDLMDDGCKLAVEPPAKGSSQGLIQLKSDRWTFITREIDGIFPNWKQCVPPMTSPKTVIRLPSQAVKQMLEVIPHLPGNEDPNQVIRLKYEFGQFKVEGHGEKAGEWTGVFIQDANITGRPVTIGLNREYLLTALKFDLSEIRIDDALSPLICVNGGRKMVIMPVKLEFPPTTTAKPATPKPATESTTPTTIPPQPNAEAKHERKTDMPRTAKPEAPKPASTQLTLIDQVEQIKETLKTAIRDLTTLAESAKQAEKDKRASEKEVEAARATLKKLQQVSL